MSVKPHKAKKQFVTEPLTRRKKTECSQGKDNTLKGVAERLKSVKPHGTKKQFVIQSLRGIRQKAGLGHVRIAA